MKAFNRIFAFVVAILIVIFVLANVIMTKNVKNSGRPYRVEISRIAKEIEQNGFEKTDISECKYITKIEKIKDNSIENADTDSDYTIRKISGSLYRFDYSADINDYSKLVINVNIILALMSLLTVSILIYIKLKILNPFEKLTNVPYELSKGNLTTPLKENKSKFFGKFFWGVDLLRENIEERKMHELKLQKEKKMLLLSLSHDIKTPLSAIKLYSKSLSKGLYKEREKQIEIAENINAKADEIEKYVSQIITASREDFLSLDVNMSEFYLSQLINEISGYYTEKLSLIKIKFTIEDFSDCIIKGDLDRSVEILQNIIENAVKYGDGKLIKLSFSEEENCQLITVTNSGCSISESEITHIFESFWRGENAENKKGSGLGLYISKQLIHKMNGEIYAQIEDNNILVTCVYNKA